MSEAAQSTVYLDATIPSYLHDERESLRAFAKITREWWRTERRRFQVVSSLATIAELRRGKYPNKADVLHLVGSVELLPPVPDLVRIAQVYVENLVMPRDAEGDALHLADASYYRIAFLLTWNCNHLANANKEPHIKRINSRLNLHTPRIVTPLELFEERP